MQDEFIDFIDIKLQSAEQTRLIVKERIDLYYHKLCLSENVFQIYFYSKFLLFSLFYAYAFELISKDVMNDLQDRVKVVVLSRCDKLKKGE